MPERQSWSNFGTADQAAIGAEATVISVICRGVARGQKVLVRAWINFLMAGASTNPSLKLRRGLLVGGTQIGDTVIVTAAATEQREGNVWAEDNAAGDDQAYNVTILAASGTLTATAYGIHAEVTGP